MPSSSVRVIFSVRVRFRARGFIRVRVRVGIWFRLKFIVKA